MEDSTFNTLMSEAEAADRARAEAAQEPDTGGAADAATGGGDKATGGAGGEGGGTGDPGEGGGEEAAEALTPEQRAIQAQANLRASRYFERQANKRAERAEQEAAELRRRLEAAGSGATAAPAPPPQIDDVVIEQVADVFPDMAADYKRLKEENEALRASAPAPAPAPEPEPEFVADQFDPEVQSVIDSVPLLRAWQYGEKNQEDWMRARALDTYLRSSEEWKDKPFKERLAEVVRLRLQERPAAANVTDDDGATAKPAPKPKPTAADAQRVIDAAKTVPLTASDVRGKAPPTDLPSRRALWAGQSNSSIIESLPEYT